MWFDLIWTNTSSSSPNKYLTRCTDVHMGTCIRCMTNLHININMFSLLVHVTWPGTKSTCISIIMKHCLIFLYIVIVIVAGSWVISSNRKYAIENYLIICFSEETKHFCYVWTVLFIRTTYLLHKICADVHHIHIHIHMCLVVRM